MAPNCTKLHQPTSHSYFDFRCAGGLPCWGEVALQASEREGPRPGMGPLAGLDGLYVVGCILRFLMIGVI